jgi:hypothetical protein
MLTTHTIVPHYKSKILSSMKEYIEWYKQEEKAEKER